LKSGAAGQQKMISQVVVGPAKKFWREINFGFLNRQKRAPKPYMQRGGTLAKDRAKGTKGLGKDRRFSNADITGETLVPGEG